MSPDEFNVCRVTDGGNTPNARGSNAPFSDVRHVYDIRIVVYELVAHPARYVVDAGRSDGGDSRAA
jgi:hypothetical protein